ncbi:MAG: GNAT family N-acetyltransferase [Candidatus Hodarchaeota archaeon]
MKTGKSSSRLAINGSPSKEEMEVVKRGLENHNKKHPNGELDIPSPDISLVLKDNEGNIVGGVVTSMLTGVMHLEVLWIDEKYRGLGYGRDLVLEAERIGREKGYTASQTWTFSFQGPEFYQAIGYEVLGICDVYADDITEYVLMKRLDENWQKPKRSGSVSQDEQSKQFTISEDKSKEAIKILGKGLGGYVTEQIGKLMKESPEIRVELVIKDDNEEIIGGIRGSSYIKTFATELLWIDEEYRGQGYGKALLMEAERIAQEKGCDSGLTWVLSFQSPEFFQKCGYEVFGVSDGYPEPVREYYFQKRF